MKVQLLDLVNQYNSLKDDIDLAISEVLSSGNYIMGPQVAEFEKNIAEYLGAKHAIGVASGSDALLLSLDALGIGSGDKVIVPTFTFFATAGAVSRLGAIPVFVDIDPVNYNIDLNQVEKLLKSDRNIKAIIPVHLFGLPVDMKRLMQLAEEHKVAIVEDACQAIDAETNCNNLKAGVVGHTGCFSFFPSKNLSCFGDGGLITTNDDKLADEIRLLRVHGAKPKYYHSIIGYNSRLDTIQAAILDVKLKHLPEWTNKRRSIASLYADEFKKAGLKGKMKWPNVYPGHVYHQFVIEVDRRDEMQTHLDAEGISTAVYYPQSLHLQDCFSFLDYKTGDLPVAEKVCNEVLAIPIDPMLSIDQVNYIVSSIIKYFK